MSDLQPIFSGSFQTRQYSAGAPPGFGANISNNENNTVLDVLANPPSTGITAENAITAAAQDVGWQNVSATSEVETITINGSPTGGQFFLVFGDQATTALAYNAASSAVQSALRALTAIGSGNVTVSGSAGGPYTVTFAGSLANKAITQAIAADWLANSFVGSTGLTGGTDVSITVEVTTSGGPALGALSPQVAINTGATTSGTMGALVCPTTRSYDPVKEFYDTASVGPNTPGTAWGGLQPTP